MSENQVELPKYKCHKEVWALKIKQVVDPTEQGNESDGSRMLVFEHPYPPTFVYRDFVIKHKPEAGSYFVWYEDGYTSISPAKAFESGYTRV